MVGGRIICTFVHIAEVDLLLPPAQWLQDTGLLVKLFIIDLVNCYCSNIMLRSWEGRSPFGTSRNSTSMILLCLLSPSTIKRRMSIWRGTRWWKYLICWLSAKHKSMINIICTVTDYLHNKKIIIDNLALIGHSLSDEEVTVHILNGLGDEYKELAVAIRARNSPVSFEELYDKLTDFEIYLKRKDKLPRQSIMAQVNQKSMRRGNQYNKTINKGLTMMPPEPLSSNQTPPPHYQHFNHDNQGGYFNHQQSWHP